MNDLIRALNGHPSLREKLIDWLGMIAGCVVLASVTTLISR